MVIPSIIFAFFGNFPNTAFFEKQQTSGAVLYGLIVYLLFYACLLMGFMGTTKPRGRTHSYTTTSGCTAYDLRKGYYYILVIIVFAYVATSTMNSIVEKGGIVDFVVDNMKKRFDPYPVERNIIDQIVNALNLEAMLKLLILVGFYFRRLLRPSFAFAWILPFLWLCYSALQGSRGTIIMAILPFIAIELIGRNQERPVPIVDKYQERKTKKKFTVFAIFFGIVLFAGYGSIRSNIEQGEDQVPIGGAVNNAVVDILGAGYGLRGLSAIVGEFGENLQYFYGKTYLDMILLPIPRSIYTSKPEWYGIDDITRAMGWPESTESAVSMPGEAYANFGIFGIFIGVVFGMLLRIFKMDFATGASPIHFLYVSFGITVLFIANWMSFTGIMNSFARLLVGYLLLRIVLKPTRKAPAAAVLQLLKEKHND